MAIDVELGEQLNFSGDREITRESIDIIELLDAARRALDLDGSVDWIGKLKKVRSTSVNIHTSLNPDKATGNILRLHTADQHIELLALLAELHIEYANLMTRKTGDGPVFSQYIDADKATPKDYGMSEDSDPHYSKLNHVSKREITERFFANIIAERILTNGYQNDKLVACRAVNYWILGERLSDKMWRSTEGEDWLISARDDAANVADRYLPVEEVAYINGHQEIELARRYA